MTVPRARLVDVHVAAAEHFVRNMRGTEADGPRAYLAERGLPHALEDPVWIIGYARPAWTGLLDHLHRAGFDDQEICAAGLTVSTRRNTLVDRFRDRIVFGLRDSDATLVGFVGRCPPHASPETPKYLNSRRTELFDKGSVLFGFAEQRAQLEHGATPVVVEGPLDALAIRQLGGPYAAVSPCGTRLTSRHADLLRRICATDRVVLANDGDDPGRDGTRFAYDYLTAGFARVLAATFSHGQDPASVGGRDPLALERAIREAGPAADLIIDKVVEPYLARLDNAEVRVCALHVGTQAIAHLATDDVSRQVARLSQHLDFPTATVTRDVLDALERVNPRPHRRQRAAYPQPTRSSSKAAPKQMSPRTIRKESP